MSFKFQKQDKFYFDFKKSQELLLWLVKAAIKDGLKLDFFITKICYIIINITTLTASPVQGRVPGKPTGG